MSSTLPNRDKNLLRPALTLTASAAFGFAVCLLFTQLRNPVPVHADTRAAAAAETPLAFELSGIGPTSALTVYSPTDHKLYIYPAVTQGGSTVNCSFTLHITRLGGPIERQNCAPGPLF